MCRHCAFTIWCYRINVYRCFYLCKLPNVNRGCVSRVSTLHVSRTRSRLHFHQLDAISCKDKCTTPLGSSCHIDHVSLFLQWLCCSWYSIYCPHAFNLHNSQHRFGKIRDINVQNVLFSNEVRRWYVHLNARPAVHNNLENTIKELHKFWSAQTH